MDGLSFTIQLPIIQDILKEPEAQNREEERQSETQAENICMITVLASYPARIMAAAVLARIFTALKYVVMIMLIVSIAYLFMKYRKLTGH